MFLAQFQSDRSRFHTVIAHSMPTIVGSYFLPCLTILHAAVTTVLPAAVSFDAEGAGFLDGGDQFLKQHVECGVRREIQSVKTCVGSEIQTVIF